MPKFKQLGVIASMPGISLYNRMHMYVAKRLGQENVQGKVLMPGDRHY
jgi:hypothetical protein